MSDGEEDTFEADFHALAEIIKELQSNGLKRCHQNVIDKLESKNINLQRAEQLIKTALEQDRLQQYQYAKLINYRLKSPNMPAATIEDPVIDATTSTEDLSLTENTPSVNINGNYVTADDLSQLKSDLLHEICAMGKQAHAPMQQQPAPTPPALGLAEEPTVVNLLMKHIEFLQNTITLLVNKLDSHSSSNPIAHPISIHPLPTQTDTRMHHLLNAEQNIQPPPPPAPPSPPSAPPPPPASPRKFTKKQVLLTGDSLLNNVDEQKMRRDAFVRVRNHPGATMQDMIDHVRAHTRHVSHDAAIILAGANDVSINNMDSNKPKLMTEDHLTTLIRELKQQLPNGAPITICQMLVRDDSAKAASDAKELNAKFKMIAQREQVEFLETKQFKKEHLGKKGLHPSASGVHKLSEILRDHIKKISQV